MSKKLIFDDLMMRDPKQAFENAISKGKINGDDYMYMSSSRWFDHFKHIDTRQYKKCFNSKKNLMTMKEFKEKKQSEI